MNHKITEKIYLKGHLKLEVLNTADALALAIKINPMFAEKFKGHKATAHFSTWLSERCNYVKFPYWERRWWLNYEVIAAVDPSRIKSPREIVEPELNFTESPKTNKPNDSVFFTINVENKFTI